jgi:O-antigen/teichoic acid export membrane protein
VLFDGILEGRFAEGLAILPLTLVYCIWYSLLTVGQDYLWCLERGKWACAAVVAGLATNVALNFLWIPVYGLSGAVWATTVSNAVALAALYWLNAKCGWRPDRGVWLAAVIPLGLLMPLPAAIAVIGVVTWGGWHYGWLLDVRERTELADALLAVVDRIPGLRRAWIRKHLFSLASTTDGQPCQM